MQRKENQTSKADQAVSGMAFTQTVRGVAHWLVEAAENRARGQKALAGWGSKMSRKHVMEFKKVLCFASGVYGQLKGQYTSEERTDEALNWFEKEPRQGEGWSELPVVEAEPEPSFMEVPKPEVPDGYFAMPDFHPVHGRIVGWIVGKVPGMG